MKKRLLILLLLPTLFVSAAENATVEQLFNVQTVKVKRLPVGRRWRRSIRPRFSKRKRSMSTPSTTPKGAAVRIWSKAPDSSFGFSVSAKMR